MSDQREDKERAEEQAPEPEPKPEPEGAHPTAEQRTAYGVEDEELA